MSDENLVRGQARDQVKQGATPYYFQYSAPKHGSGGGFLFVRERKEEMDRLRLAGMVLGLVLLIVINVFAQSNTNEVALDRIVVTSSKDFFREDVYSSGMAVEIFTAEDIKETRALQLWWNF